jgi:hypothetical protein
VRALAPIPGFGEPYNSSLVVSIAYGLNDTESYDDLTKAVAEAFKQVGGACDGSRCKGEGSAM